MKIVSSKKKTTSFPSEKPSINLTKGDFTSDCTEWIGPNICGKCNKTMSTDSFEEMYICVTFQIKGTLV
jgi:hypothetical protein